MNSHSPAESSLAKHVNRSKEAEGLRAIIRHPSSDPVLKVRSIDRLVKLDRPGWEVLSSLATDPTLPEGLRRLAEDAYRESIGTRPLRSTAQR